MRSFQEQSRFGEPKREESPRAWLALVSFALLGLAFFEYEASGRSAG